MSLLTSVTLLLIGWKGKVDIASAGRRQRKPSHGIAEEVQQPGSSQVARQTAERILTVGLPFYATAKLGGDRVALVLLTVLASKIMTVEDQSADHKQIKVWRQLLCHRKWTLASIFLQLVCDLTGSSNGSSTVNVFFGYTALALAIFVFPPCFPASTPNAFYVTSSARVTEPSTSSSLVMPWQKPQHLEDNSLLAPAVSPLIRTPDDVNLTLWSGTILGLVSVIMLLLWGRSAGALPFAQLALALLSACAAALALAVGDSKCLQTNRNIGLVLSSLLGSTFLTTIGGGPWTLFAYQILFTSVSFAATIIDTHAALPVSSHYEQHHHQHHAKSHSSEHAQMSRFSEFVLRNVPRWPLLHSILTEKDSRRIFYFMW